MPSSEPLVQNRVMPLLGAHTGIALLETLRRHRHLREVLLRYLIRAIEVGVIQNAESLRLRVVLITFWKPVFLPLFAPRNIFRVGVPPVTEIELPKSALLLETHQLVEARPHRRIEIVYADEDDLRQVCPCVRVRFRSLVIS